MTVDKRKRFLELQRIAKEHGGFCLSSEYINNRNPMQWRCKEGHIWNATANTIIDQKSWCQKCAINRRLCITDLQKIAKEHGGELLSEVYHRSTPLRWRCDKGHEWEVKADNVINNGTWCPYCAGRIVILEDAKELAKSNGGECLSMSYKGSQTKLDWKCSNGHTWSASYNSIQRGCWCPYCSRRKNEKLCAEHLESLLGKPFPKVKPSWLAGLELDGYNNELKIAFEYQGEQHFKPHKFFHQNQSLAHIKQRDDTKIKACKNNGVLLIQIPYTVKQRDLKSFIEGELEKLRL